MSICGKLRFCAKTIMSIAASASLAGAPSAPQRPIAHPQPAEGARTVLELPPGPGNPRNSEGSFVTLRDGRIMYAYTRFTTAIRDGIPDSGEAEIVARFSCDGGLTWTAEDTPVIANEGALNVCCATLLRLQSGEIALFYLRKNSLVDCRPVMRRSFDEGATWGEPVECITDEVGYYVLNNDRVIQLRDGRLLFAVSLHIVRDEKSFHEMAEVVTYSSDDNGATWRRGQSRLRVRTPDGIQHPAQEPGVVELRDGRVLLWIRTDAGCQYFCNSSDRGETWTEPRPSPFVSPLSPASMKRLPTGDLLALWNDHATRPEMKTRGPKWAYGARTPRAAVVSRDDGATWDAVRLIEDEPDGWYCYTAIHPLDDGTVLLAYCAYEELAHSRIVKVPVAWFYGKDELCGAPRRQARAEIIWTRPLCKEPGRYIGWPTIGKGPNGDLLAVFSRDSHICPWGKTQMIRSSDGGETWSAPETICNSLIDDRDGGILLLDDGTLLFTWFTSVAYRDRIIRDRSKLDPASREFQWRLHDEKLPPALVKEQLGAFTRRSTDGGRTWEPPVRTPCAAPHGPIQLRDGRLLYVGKSGDVDHAGLGKGVGKIVAAESTDRGRSWHLIGEVPFPDGMNVLRLCHEPHAIETDDGRIIAQIRYEWPGRPDSPHESIQTESADGGRTWTEPKPVGLDGFPPHLLRLADGTLLSAYGRRHGERGEYACLSDDQGRTWDVANEIKLAGHWSGDIGYPSSVQRPDGAILTAYYQSEREGEPPCLMGTLWRVVK